MTPAEAEARRAGEQLAKRSREQQQLPRRVRDPEAVRKIVALLVTPRGSAALVNRRAGAAWKS